MMKKVYCHQRTRLEFHHLISEFELDHHGKKPPNCWVVKPEKTPENINHKKL